MIWIKLGSFLGLLVVILGAFGAHTFKNILTSNGNIDIYNKAVLYHMFHTLIIIIIGLIELILNKTLLFTGLYFTIGIIIFSGSLYILSITNIKLLGAITPIGGIFFILGWLSLLYSMYKNVI